MRCSIFLLSFFRANSSDGDRNFLYKDPADQDTLGGVDVQPSLNRCPKLEDENGRWEGSTERGGLYNLACAPGFQVVGSNGSRTKSLICPQSLSWPQDMKCENIDDCAKLEHGCGAFGVCRDLIDGYDCNCEEGYLRRRSRTGEIVCEGSGDDLCGGHTCGAYGICIDLQGNDASFDTEDHTLGARISVNVTEPVGHTTYRCECADGFFDDGVTCARKDCGALADALGIWSGGTLFGQEYTLICPEDAFVWGGGLSQVTISCSAKGVWPSHPVPICVSPLREALDAGFATVRFWTSIASAGLCVLCGAVAAGLTLGLTSLEPFELAVTMATRPEDCSDQSAVQKLKRDQACATDILPTVRDRHLLLVTLLLFNTVANESLPIFLDELVPSFVAVLVSVTVVLFCGEVLPSAIFTGPSQLIIVARCIPLVRTLKALFYIVAKPIALALDWLVGEDGIKIERKYSRAELMAFLLLHSEEDPEKGEMGADRHPDARHDAEAQHRVAVLAEAEVRTLGRILELQGFILRDIGYVPLASCLLADRHERAADVLGRSFPGVEAVIVTRGPAEGQDVADNLPASSVLGCLSLRELVLGCEDLAENLLGWEPVTLLPLSASALHALRLLSDSGSSRGVVCTHSDRSSAVHGIVTRRQLLQLIARLDLTVPCQAGDTLSLVPPSPPRLRRQMTAGYSRRAWGFGGVSEVTTSSLCGREGRAGGQYSVIDDAE